MVKIELKYIVTENENNAEVAKILRNKLRISNRLLIKLKMNEKILVNNKPVYSNYIVNTDDVLKVKIDFEEEDFIKPESMELDIIYEDEYLLAVNKPAGIVVHPSANHLSNTLANGVKAYLNNKKKIRPINRLDRDTSGIVLFAKNEYIQELMISYTNISKHYLAIIDGILEKKSGTINLPISRKKGSIMEREVSEEGQIAITHYEVINKIEIEDNLGRRKVSLVNVELETGRTHQIRVHFAHLGTSILGDTLYGVKSSLINRHALHAYCIEFIHPITCEKIRIDAKLPYDLLQICEKGAQ